MTTVFVVEDDVQIRSGLLYQLQRWGYEATAMASAESALAALLVADRTLPDLLLADIRLPGQSGVDMIRRLAEAGRLPPTIIVSGEASMTETVAALELGVHDFIEKPFSAERLRRSLVNTLEHSQLSRDVDFLRSELEDRGRILGSSEAIVKLRADLDKVARTDGRVLILGESGTGKELVADTIHRKSSRSGQPFIKLNCAAIPPDLIEDELFGHAAGAFTGARHAKAGLFEEADRGTLFLDEIGDMDYTLQSRLLRVLEDGRFRRVGETRDRTVDVRILAATHADLEGAIESKAFRSDLYFRLAHLVVAVPPLRERPGDLRELTSVFLERSARRHRVRLREVDEAVFPILERYDWPGNVRQLESLCQRLVVFGADRIRVEDLPESIRAPVARQEQDSPEVPGIVPLSEFKEQSTRAYLISVLETTEWNVAAAARRLEISRSHLHQRMSQLSIHRPKSE